jgi:sigma-B regulation protein RsbU (phosphoserine phosphatase)
MRIRWKLLILMLVISLGPLGVALYVSLGAAKDLGNRLATQTRENLLLDANRFLQRTVLDHGRLLQAQARLAEQNVRLLARETEQALAGPVPPDPQIIMIDELPADSSPDRWVGPLIAPGSPATRPAALTRQGFYLTADADRQQVEPDMARLSTLLPTFRMIHDSRPGMFLWQYVSLDSGVHTFFPGHGDLPADYDPRVRDWYTMTREAGALTWRGPLTDAKTLQPVLTVAKPVRDAADRIVGICALDLRVADVIAEVRLPDEWSAQAEMMLLNAAINEETGGPSLYVVVKRSFMARSDWESSPAPEYLNPQETEHFAAIYDDVLHERPGFRRLPYRGRDAFWVYGPLHGMESALFVVVPYDVVVARAQAAEQDVREALKRQRMLVGGLILTVVLTVLLLTLVASRQVTRPVRELAEAAHRIAAGDLTTPVRVRSRDELGELGRTVNAMLPQLRDRLRIREALGVAMEVQQSLLPRDPPRIERLDVAGTSIYCDETGGDYYDFVDLSAITPHTLGVAVGDVTGHGVAAALLMATGRALLRSRSDLPGSVGDFLNHVNRHLSQDATGGRFMTLHYMLFDTQAGRVRWACAGHDPAIVYDPASGAFSEWGGGGIPLGIDGRWQYEELGPEPLRTGQVIVVGTDGIWEARNQCNEMFGKDRLRAVISARHEHSAEAINQAITREVSTFRGEHTQEDDITLVVLKVLPEA